MKKLLISLCLLTGCLHPATAQNLVFHAGGGWTSLNGSSTKNIGAFKIGTSIEFELTKTELSRVEETKDGTFRIAHSGAELKEVGALFHNCVFSYTEMMNNKMCTIYYLVQQGKARACLEVRDKMIMQASGPCNRRLDKDATTAVLEWAVRHKLKLGTYCMRGH